MLQSTLLGILRRQILNHKLQNEELLELAYIHGIGHVIADRICLNRKQHLLNKFLKEKNTNQYLENIFHAYPVLCQLEAMGIKYVVTKGISIAEVAYKHDGFRGSEDLDVIVNRKDYSKIKELLLKNGYEQGVYNPVEKSIKKFSREQELFYLSYTKQAAPFVKRTGNQLIPVANFDLNFHISWEKKDPFPIETILNHTKKIQYRGFEIKVLEDEYLLLHVCLHAYYDLNSVYVLYKEYSYRLKYFLDIYGLIKNSNVSWEKFNRICLDFKMEKYVMYMIYYTALVFQDESILYISGLEIPEETFLNQFGLSGEGSYLWEEDFWERLFCFDRENLIKKYISRELQLKIEQGKFLEGN